MLGNPYLRLAEHFLKMAHAHRPLCEHMEQPQPRLITQALVNFDQFHRKIAYAVRNMVQAPIFDHPRFRPLPPWCLASLDHSAVRSPGVAHALTAAVAAFTYKLVNGDE